MAHFNNSLTKSTSTQHIANQKISTGSKVRKLTAAVAISTLTLASLAQPAFAARSENQQAALEAGTITTTAIAGAVAGGPIGFMAGGLIGMFLSNETRQGNQAEIDLASAEVSLNALNNNIDELNDEIHNKEMTIAVLEQKTIDKLALQVLFSTGKDALNEQDLARLEVLADHLKANQDLHINLSGHTDPRGTDEYNNVLAQERANNVQQALIDFGIDAERILSTGHGASFSTAQQGHYDDYARDRRVEIEVTNTKNQQPVAAVK